MDEYDMRAVRTPPLPRDDPETGHAMTPPQVEDRRSRTRDREQERRSRARSSRSRRSLGRSSRITADGTRSSRRRSRSRSRRSRSQTRLSSSHAHRSPARPRRSRSRSRRSRSRRSRSRRSRSRRSRTRSRRSRSRSQSRRHRRSQPRYCDNELLGTLKDLFRAVRSEDRSDHVERFPVMNVLPEFDPANRSQTIDVWLNKVNETASIYNWTERQIVHYALPKLSGVAQKWYQGLTSLKHTWPEWQVKLKTAFPIAGEMTKKFCGREIIIMLLITWWWRGICKGSEEYYCRNSKLQFRPKLKADGASKFSNGDHVPDNEILEGHP
ncbi:pre-mRNA-splicing factor CWC22 homolog [Leguminivora glycinivorella]|uniref:pre-mRNA-splicing factor CWC22 homolog n=1 Tax=Leguminivora glycinivorella TaxID=1035111 RepID=UPI0020103E2D|nr:pre-mRNA-splicing factor CWC22 homolog [Leguminivora glycinivorella]